MATVASLTVLAALAGAGSGLISKSVLSAQTACDKQACDTEYHTCFNTDINYKCSGDPCKSTACDSGGGGGGGGGGDPVDPEG